MFSFLPLTYYFFPDFVGVQHDQSNMCIKAEENYFESSQVFITVRPYMILWEKADYGACNYSKIVEFSVHTLRKPFKIFVCGYYLFWWLNFIISTLLGLFTLHLFFRYSFLKTQINLGLFGLSCWRI